MTCQICGNESPVSRSTCPYCGAVADEPTLRGKAVFIHKTVNLEAGRPTVEVAMNRCREAINDAIRNKISVITFIHGYGSSGKGGVIRSECRQILAYMKNKRIISDYVAGEDFHKRSARVRGLMQRYSALAKERNLNQGNQGVTLVILF